MTAFRFTTTTVLCFFRHLTGTSTGSVLVFDVPSKGSNITLSEVLEEHKESITDMASECSGSLVIEFHQPVYLLLASSCYNSWKVSLSLVLPQWP